MIDSDERIGERLAALRDMLGLKQAQIAEIIGISQPQWNQYERGKRKLTIEVAASIAKTYGVTLDWLYFGDAGGLPLRFTSIAAA
jgi:transcriptional regulator with XRE-family HTH domain